MEVKQETYRSKSACNSVHFCPQIPDSLSDIIPEAPASTFHTLWPTPCNITAIQYRPIVFYWYRLVEIFYSTNLSAVNPMNKNIRDGGINK